jgi:hypothetical protein
VPTLERDVGFVETPQEEEPQILVAETESTSDRTLRMNPLEGGPGHSRGALLRVGRAGVPVFFISLCLLGILDTNAFVIFVVWMVTMMMIYWVVSYRCRNCGAAWGGDRNVGPIDALSVASRAFFGSTGQHCRKPLR